MRKYNGSGHPGGVNFTMGGRRFSREQTRPIPRESSYNNEMFPFDIDAFGIHPLGPSLIGIARRSAHTIPAPEPNSDDNPHA